jgi:hypothetical protein
VAKKRVGQAAVPGRSASARTEAAALVQEAVERAAAGAVRRRLGLIARRIATTIRRRRQATMRRRFVDARSVSRGVGSVWTASAALAIVS